MAMTRGGARRKRAAFSLVEVLIAIVIIAVALGGLLEVFYHYLKLTVQSSRNSGDLMAAHAQVQKFFFTGQNPAGETSLPGDLSLELKEGTGPSVTLGILRHDVGAERPLRVYRYKVP